VNSQNFPQVPNTGSSPLGRNRREGTEKGQFFPGSIAGEQDRMQRIKRLMQEIDGMAGMLSSSEHRILQHTDPELLGFETGKHSHGDWGSEMMGLEQPIQEDGHIGIWSLGHHFLQCAGSLDLLEIGAVVGSSARAPLGPFENRHDPGDGNEKERIKKLIQELDTEMGMSSLKHNLL